MRITERARTDFASELKATGHGMATVEKYRREAETFAVWLGDRELTAAELAALRGAVSGQPAPAAEEKRPQGKKPARTPEERYRKAYGGPFDRRHLRREEPGRGGKGRRNSWGG